MGFREDARPKIQWKVRTQQRHPLSIYSQTLNASAAIILNLTEYKVKLLTGVVFDRSKDICLPTSNFSNEDSAIALAKHSATVSRYAFL
jgi:hypothetical protein